LGNVLNPKVGIFYLSFLPQFIPQGQPLIIWTFGLVGIHVALSLVWALLLIGATQPLGHWLRRAAVIRWMDRCTGLIFVLFAARLALSRR
jgi:threonine/homoserine/homoserine lactone efflux protein